MHAKEVATVLVPFTGCTSKTNCYKEAASILLTVNKTTNQNNALKFSVGCQVDDPLLLIACFNVTGKKNGRKIEWVRSDFLLCLFFTLA